ncbi:MAG: MerR family transcriptional regulator [Clostridiales bacterium]|nr:MerR family transcriptional regulator [Clostridiales bacterium]
MKEDYKINEISKLYGIGIDSLRYYEELGILKPRRDSNRYRLYSLKDIYKLNIIRDLRKLDFSMKQIKEYLDHQCLENTLGLLHEEQEYVGNQIRILRARKQIIQNRIRTLESMSKIQTGVFSVKNLPDRYCVQLNEYITRDEEMDIVIKKIHSKYEDRILDFGNQTIGASISMEDLRKGLRNVYRSVFFILEQDTKDYDFQLPAGQYVSYYYKGDYNQNLERITETLSYIKEIGGCPMGDPFEIYEIDNRDTLKRDEFLTEIQIRINF